MKLDTVVTLRILGRLSFLALIVFSIVALKQSNGQVSTPSYQAQNLEVLKSAQPKDLLLCETQDGSSQPKIRRAFLVDKNDGERLIGTALEQRIAIRTEKDGLPILAVSSWQCKFRTVKNAGSENEIVTIILHGPDKLAEVN